MRKRMAIGMLLLAGTAAAQTPVVDEDERWIERYMAAAPAARSATAPVAGGDSLAFDALRQHLGRSLRVRLRDGRERRGVLERADGQTAQLSADVKGGRFSYSLRRDQVVRIQLEDAP